MSSHISHSSGSSLHFSSRLKEWLAFDYGSTDEPVEGCKMFVQHLDLFHTGGWPHVHNCWYLVGISLDAPSVIRYPKNFPEATPNVHFSGLSFTLYCLRRSKALSRYWRWSARCTLFTNISSMYTSIVFLIRSLKTLFTIRRKVVPVFLSPNGITL